MQEEKINNLIHNIARAANIADKEIVRQAAFLVIDDYGVTDKLMLLERLYFFLTDGQERRFIVTEFRKRVTEAQARLLDKTGGTDILMEKRRTELTSETHREHRHYIVEWRVGNISHAPFVAIDDLESGPYSNAASLTPEEALNLLAWLEQEKERLQEALLTEFRIEIQQGPGMA